jgi:uncharacterized protein (TIGR03118 family)
MKTGIGIALGLALLSTTALASGTATKAKKPGSAGTAFQVTNLISNQDGTANTTDSNLVNPWGIAQGDHGPFWISDNGTGVSTVYRHSGVKEPLTVTIPTGAPTGITFVPADANGNTIFPVSENGTTGSSQFIFGTETGRIEGWSATVDLNNAIVAVDGSDHGAVYKGVSLSEGHGLLYAADFKNNWVEVYDSNFNLVNKFRDRQLPGHFAPFNVRVMGGEVFVAFAEREKGGIDNVDGPGLGYIDIFHRDGHLKTRLVANGVLNAPWGMTIAPSTFGTFAGALLVGNFGDGKINAFDRNTGDMLGTLSDSNGDPIVIDGLWALEPRPFGSVTFSSGPDGEANGLVGSITPVTQTAQN